MPRREHFSKKEESNLISWFKLDGNFYEEISGADVASMYGWPNSEYKNWRWINDPDGSGTQCLARSSTLGGSGNTQAIPPFLMNGSEYRTDNPSYLKLITQCPGSNYSAAAYSYLLGKTLEFEWYPNTNSKNVYILEAYDGLLGSNANMYAAELYRSGTTLIMKFSTGTKTLCSFTNGKWYKIVIIFIDNLNNTYSTHFKVYDNDTLVADSDNISGMPTITYGSSNKNNRQMLFFNAHYGYHTTAANLTDYLRNVKIYINN